MGASSKSLAFPNKNGQTWLSGLFTLLPLCPSLPSCLNADVTVKPEQLSCFSEAKIHVEKDQEN